MKKKKSTFNSWPLLPNWNKAAGRFDSTTSRLNPTYFRTNAMKSLKKKAKNVLHMIGQPRGGGGGEGRLKQEYAPRFQKVVQIIHTHAENDR